MSKPGADVTWRQWLPPSLVAGLVGLALNVWCTIGLYDHLDVRFGSVPVFVAALVLGWKGGVVAGAIASLAPSLHWGTPAVSLLYILEALAVGAARYRLHPAVTLLGFWLVIGLPFFALFARVDPTGFGAYSTALALKTPMQEIFAALLAQTLLLLAPLRHSILKRMPFMRLPVVSLPSFQLTFVALALMAVTGCMLFVSAHSLYDYERRSLNDYNEVAAIAVEARLDTLMDSYGSAVITLANTGWNGLTAAERERSARQLLDSGNFVGMVWLDSNYRVQSGWTRVDGQIQPIPPGMDFGRYRALESSPNISRGIFMSGELLQEPILVLLAPAAGGGYVGGAISLKGLEQRLAHVAVLGSTQVQIVDAQGNLLAESGQPKARLPRPTPWNLPGISAQDKDIVTVKPISGTNWHIRLVTPAWVLRDLVNGAMREVLPTLLVVLLVLGVIGLGLMAVLSREIRELGRVTRQLGRLDMAVTEPPDTPLHEVSDLYGTFKHVAASLDQTLKALSTREAELTLANSKLGATVDELKALDASRGEVLNTISHDIKIPLTAIMGYAELLEDEAVGKLNDDQQRFVKGIEDNSERVIRLVDDLLDLTRLEVGRFSIETEALELPEALERTRRNLQPLLDRKNMPMTVEASRDLSPVCADPVRFEQVLNNLLSNAIKYTQPGGHIKLRAYPSPEGNAAVVQVIDNGPGIPTEHLPHLFDRFYRVPGTQGPGTGLGLPISKNLVETMGGHIGVITEPGKGSTFWFTLPDVASRRPSAEPTSTEPPH